MTYTIKVTREDKWWVAEVNGVLGGATETTRLADLETEVRDLLAGLLDEDEDSFELRWDFSAVLGEDGQAMWENYLAERAELHARRQKFEVDRAETLRALRGAGFSVRDSATLVDISHQRVAQILGS